MFRAIASRRPLAGRPAAARIRLRLTGGLRVGILGGSFDPPHEGHWHVAEAARRRLGLDRVIWLVTPGNPLKNLAGLAPLTTRLAEVARLAHGPDMVVTDLERPLGSRYTVDTVRWLEGRYPSVKFVWIMGADNLAGFHSWKGWGDLAREIPIAIVSRPGHALKSRFSPMARRFAWARIPLERAGRLADMAPPAWVYIPAPFRFVSSTAIRQSRLKSRPDRAI